MQENAVTCIIYLPVKQGFVLEIQALGGSGAGGGGGVDREIKIYFTFMFLILRRNCSVFKEWLRFEKNWHSAQINILLYLVWVFFFFPVTNPGSYIAVSISMSLFI